MTRKSGVLLHPTSLAGSPGIGTLGKSAYEFVDWLHEGRQTLWQILPLGPTGYGDSPYASFSTFAGNPLLIDLDALVKKGWASEELVSPPEFIKSSGPVDYGALVYWKLPLLLKCASFFREHISAKDAAAFERFKNENGDWLHDYATFSAIKNEYDKKAAAEKVWGVASMWNAFWPRPLSSCEKNAVSDWAASHVDEIENIKAVQFFFFEQWTALKKYASDLGIQIIGDIPIFIAPDSADVWANQKFFQLDENGIPLKVSGVPPDYFSETGQLWGNPLYDWKTHKADGYRWWISRIAHTLRLVDYVRIDHFRGFEANWAVPYGEETAVNGKWEKGPGVELFDAIKKSLGTLPIIAEDLGVITDEVRALRDGCGFPGMKVLLFAFDGNGEYMTNSFLPHEYESANCVCYTGTHDNDTTQGWLMRETDEKITRVLEYIEGKPVNAARARATVSTGELCAEIVKLAFASNAAFTVVPLQDILRLDNSARMNEPSTLGKNWKWRMAGDALTGERAARLAFMSRLYGRNVG